MNIGDKLLQAAKGATKDTTEMLVSHKIYKEYFKYYSETFTAVKIDINHTDFKFCGPPINGKISADQIALVATDTIKKDEIILR